MHHEKEKWKEHNGKNNEIVNKIVHFGGEQKKIFKKTCMTKNLKFKQNPLCSLKGQEHSSCREKHRIKGPGGLKCLRKHIFNSCFCK